MNSKKFISASIVVIISLVFLNCGAKNPFFFEDDFTTVPKPYDIEGVTPIIHDSGLIEYVLKEGTGDFKVNNRDVVLVYYTGRKTNGEVFDSSFKNGRISPVNFEVVGVVQGFRMGLLDMKEGGKKVLVVPPDLGYGGTGHVLSSDTLIFDIQLDTILN